jgi:hypothetical protein
MTDTPTPISDEARTNGALSSPTTAYDLCVMLEREAIDAHESFLKASSHAFQFGKERDELRERVRELESWIATAAPVFESACCIVIKDGAYRFHEIAGCRGIIESCPVELESTKTKEGK